MEGKGSGHHNNHKGGRPRTNRKTYTLTMTEQTKSLLDQLAEREQISKSDLLAKALEAYSHQPYAAI